MQTFADIDRSLVLVWQALAVEERLIAFHGNANRFHMMQFRKPLHDFRPNLHLRQVLLGVVHLGIDPRASLGTVLIFEPAIGVAQRMSGNGLAHRFGVSCWWRRKHDSVPAVNFFLRQICRNPDKAGNQGARKYQTNFHEQIFTTNCRSAADVALWLARVA